MEYQGTMNLIDIARGEGVPLKLDPHIQRVGSYARIQVDVDCSNELPVKILVQRKKLGFDFFC